MFDVTRILNAIEQGDAKAADEFKRTDFTSWIVQTESIEAGHLKLSLVETK